MKEVRRPTHNQKSQNGWENQQSGRKHQQCRIGIQHKKQDGQDFQELKAQLIKKPHSEKDYQQLDQADRRISGMEEEWRKYYVQISTLEKKIRLERWQKHLLCEQEKLNLDPSTHAKSQV